MNSPPGNSPLKSAEYRLYVSIQFCNMASLNNTSIEPLTIVSENIENTVNPTIENGVNPTNIKWKVQLDRKKIIPWCFIPISFIIILMATIMVLVLYSRTESHLGPDHVQVNCILKVDCRKESGCSVFCLLSQKPKYAIHLYMILSAIEENKITSQNVWKMFKKLNSTIFNIEKSQNKLERKIEKNKKAFNQENFNYGLSLNHDKEQMESGRHEMTSESSGLNSSEPLNGDKAKNNTEKISWKTFLVNTLLTLG